MATSKRARNTIIKGAFADVDVPMEFHLVRVSRFFARENIFTVFPACKAFAEAMERSEGEPSKGQTYLLYTFQSGKYVGTAASDAELAEERAAFEAAVPGDGEKKGMRSIIGYEPETQIWKNESREHFFQFMSRVQQVLEDTMPDSSEGRGSPSFFIDWSDSETGLPMRTERGGSTFVDSDAIQQHFSFDSMLIVGAKGACQITVHPVFGETMYPATAVIHCATRDEDRLKEALLTLARPDSSNK